MNEKTKKAALIGIVVVAVLAAAYGATGFFKGDQMVVEKSYPAPAGHKSEKQLAMEAQQSGQADPAAGSEKSEKDAAGPSGG